MPHQDTVPGHLLETPPPYQRRRVVWDPTINVTHVVNFALGLVAVVGVYYNLDKRVSKQEDMAPIIEKARQEKDQANAAFQFQLSADVRELKTSVDKLKVAFDIQTALTEQKEKRK